MRKYVFHGIAMVRDKEDELGLEFGRNVARRGRRV